MRRVEFAPCLPTRGIAVPAGPDWIHEIKHNGYRLTVHHEGKRATDNIKKDPNEWVSGDDPMTGAQASYLKTLGEQARTPELYNDDLTKAEASKLIDNRAPNERERGFALYPLATGHSVFT